ncbi:unnamed protein product [Phytophthora fragariaefolia]|uniref:Unnamed protein product n=1 Tax=Phytophthora fragariaefolia TaxID=1490495 RepID=A0A9W6XNB2_9STRA|nr:unnamed protein product [Phytophthora fragariaefolia]
MSSSPLEETPTRPQQAAAREAQNSVGRSKGRNFEAEEGGMLCKAYLHFGKDAGTGTGQAAAKFWSRVAEYYNEHRPDGADREYNRNPRALACIRITATLFFSLRRARRSKSIRGKLQRWSLKLTELCYTIEHISGEDNVWVDMVSRWAGAVPPASDTIIKRWQLVVAPEPQQLRPLGPDSEWPDAQDIVSVQNNSKLPRPSQLTQDSEGGWRDAKNRFWLPPDADVLLFRLMVIAHCGTMDHRGMKEMINHLQEHFFIEKLESKVRDFSARYLLCCYVKGGNIIPRPWGETYRSKERNEALHMDYLFIGEYNDSKPYLLVLKDDFSHFCELIECSNADAATAAKAILDWNRRYGMPKLLVSNTAAHFKNQLLEELCHKTQMTQSFTLAYCPWINGSIERLNRDVLQVLRVMLLKYKVAQQNWTALVPLIQANINHSPVASLSNHSPAEVFAGAKATTSLQKRLVGKDTIAANVRETNAVT